MRAAISSISGARLPLTIQSQRIGCMIASDARILVEQPYLIFYRRRSDHVQIVRVLHGARDIDTQLITEGFE